MSFWVSFIFLLLFSFLAYSRASAQRPSYVYHLCSNTTPYSRNSHYFTNLKTLLSSLSSPKASYSTGFQNATAGQAPDRVTGLFLCRGDLSTEVCRSCVTFSVSEALTRCPNEREAVLYYDECMLRYSHQNILSTLTIHGGTIRLNNTRISSNQVDRFKELVSSTMNQAAQEAANSSSKFYTKKANWTVFQALYGLVQCTPDLTIQDCIDCLQESINGLHLDKIGGKLFWPSCSSRYELYAFYNQTTNKIPPASTPPRTGKKGNPNVFTLGICVAIIVAVLLSLTGFCLFAKCTKKAYNTATLLDDDKTAIESLQLDYTTIQDATNEFSESNKIGEGGFGEVYKGTLSNGMEVAVKKLSKSSKQGDTEFKNEVVVVARLQHRNLVRLLGFCLERGERILVYEYVPNKSLDYFLFDPAKQGQLDWIKRYNIIGGIARGILYLHQDSRFTIIHRDIKAGNILLDADMTPKVADFGMARIFGMDQTQEKTSKIAGTYGYMSPEYAMRGQFSMKSDVYSFGILVLEIISGRKVRSFYMTDGAHDLVTYAWRLWSRGTALALVDPIIVENCQKSEVVRCLHIGLICVQKDPLNRPTFSTICDMLTSNTITLPVPQQPGFFVQNRPNEHLLDSDQAMMKNSVPTSIDDASITELYPR